MEKIKKQKGKIVYDIALLAAMKEGENSGKGSLGKVKKHLAKIAKKT
jgi:hypothetical protein